MKYCVVKNIVSNMTTGSIAQGEDTEKLIGNALTSGFILEEIEILTEEEYKIKIDLLPKPIVEPTEIEILQEENSELRTRLYQTESITAETSATQEMLIELLLDLGVM